jgi:hypothetical protein
MRKLLVAVLFGIVAGACAAPEASVLRAPTSTVAPDPEVTIVAITPPPTAIPRPATPAPTPVPTPAPAGLAAFRGLGSWIDVFDHKDDPATVLPLVRAMAAQGVRTLYLETARFSSATDIQYPAAVGAALDEAKTLGMRVVAWYPPAFADPERDLRRSLAAVRFVSPQGNRFDGFAADIEYTQGVPDHTKRSQLAVEYSQRLRAAVGSSYPLAAIVIPPTFLVHQPNRWPGFPWASLAPLYDLFMPMNYWTAFGKDPGTATDQTQRNTTETKRLTGKPIHIIGGLGEDADEPQVSAYAGAARESGSIGGGLYDFATTSQGVWNALRTLNQ